ncbi:MULTISPECIES: site-specific integrase [Rhodococcus]|uniref:site-specific integrase n=1 Tax=Rhodococcus TaxID=1827 RepID=UPI000A8486EA|nr:site-specific integrase [Rhodococcus koreensis]
MAPAERYLRYLADIERSPNTIKAHAHDLKDWFTFLGEIECDWQTVRLEESERSSDGCGDLRYTL